MIVVIVFIVKPSLVFVYLEVKLIGIGLANCLLCDLVLVFVYLLFYALITGFLGESALAPFYSVQHRGIFLMLLPHTTEVEVIMKLHAALFPLLHKLL